VKQGLLTLAALSLTAAAALPASAQIGSGSIRNIVQGTFNLAEAYPCTAGTYAAASGITNEQVFTGTCPAQSGAPSAAPGILCLQRSGTALNVNCFAVIPAGEAGPIFVQSYRLTKQVPGSFKCPDVYGLPHFVNDSNGNPKLAPYQYFQFGTGVRTWWSLNFTQPGTRFILEVVSVDRAGAVTDDKGNVLAAGGTPLLHNDTWTWRVVADVNTLAYVIELMHGGAVSTLEVPCIIGEDMYDALKAAQSRLAGAVTSGNLTNVGNAIFDFEALIVSNCLFVDVLDPLLEFPGPMQFSAPNIQPPGNLAPTVSFATGGTAIAGIIDTLEHPCCCKLLVDLEWITLRQGLVGQTPTLPTF
jgi:hypothetical protein